MKYSQNLCRKLCLKKDMQLNDLSQNEHPCSFHSCQEIKHGKHWPSGPLSGTPPTALSIGNHYPAFVQSPPHSFGPAKHASETLWFNMLSSLYMNRCEQYLFFYVRFLLINIVFVWLIPVCMQLQFIIITERYCLVLINCNVLTINTHLKGFQMLCMPLFIFFCIFHFLKF